MKLFKSKNAYKEFIEFPYKVGDAIDVYLNSKWEVHEVKQHDDGEIYLQPYTSGFNLNWLYNLHECKTRQTPETFKKARKILEEEKQRQLDLINHVREKDTIKEIEVMLKKLPKDKNENPKN